MTLKATYQQGNAGLFASLNSAFDLGRRLVQPQYFNQTLSDAVTVAATSPMFTIANSGSNAPIGPGFTVSYVVSGTTYSFTTASTIAAGSTFDVTVAPTVTAADKTLTYSSPYPAGYTTLTNGLASAAASGTTKFTITLITVDNPAYLRMNGAYLDAYLAGIYQALADEGIFSTYEVTLELNTSDSINTGIDFNFTFNVG